MSLRSALQAPVMTPIRHVIYLHGFASSRHRRKRSGSRELRARGVSFDCPDLNEPSFETLTVTRMIAQVDAAIARAPQDRSR